MTWKNITVTWSFGHPEAMPMFVSERFADSRQGSPLLFHDAGPDIVCHSQQVDVLKLVGCLQYLITLLQPWTSNRDIWCIQQHISLICTKHRVDWRLGRVPDLHGAVCRCSYHKRTIQGVCDALETPTILCTGDDRVLQQQHRSARGWQINDGNMSSGFQADSISSYPISVRFTMKHNENAQE